MALFNDINDATDKMKEEREAKKVQEQAKQEAEDKAKKEPAQHEENKKQGMI